MMERDWIKVYVRMYEHEKLQIINSMPEKDLVSYVWIRLLLHAGKTNDDGKIYISKNMPYSMETLGMVFARTREEIESALKILKELNMITIDDKHIIKIKNWCKYQSSKSLDKNREQSKIRMRNKRKRDKEKAEAISLESDNECYADVTPHNKREIKSTEEELEEDINKKERRKSNVVSLEERKCEGVNEEAVEILNHYEAITGKTGIFKFESIVLAISKHGADNVKMAFDKAIEAGKITMRYVNGILRNWAKEGYPKESEFANGNRGANENGGKFKNIKPPEPKVLTDEERKNIKELI